MKKILIICGLSIMLFSCSNPNTEKPSDKIDSDIRESKIMLGEKANKLPKERHIYSAFVLVKSLDIKKIKSGIESFYKTKAKTKNDESILFSVIKNNWVLLKIPENYTFGDIAFLTTWIEEDVYAIFIDKDNPEGNFYFLNADELNGKDCILGHFKGGESFKIYIPDASWGDIINNSYQYTYSMDKSIINQLDSIGVQGDKVDFRAFQDK